MSGTSPKDSNLVQPEALLGSRNVLRQDFKKFYPEFQILHNSFFVWSRYLKNLSLKKPLLFDFYSREIFRS